MFALFAAIGTFLYGTLAGWGIHKAIHQRWAGRFYRAHMTHHVKLYPPLDLVSEKYRSAGKDNSNLVFIPAITVAFAALEFLMWKIGASVGTLVMLVIEGIIIGALHDLMHTWFHLSGTRLLKYEWFQRLKRYHFYHHHHMQQNFGIIWFGWDRVFGTFRNRGRLVGQTGVEPA